jgi:hypothetical protein
VPVAWSRNEETRSRNVVSTPGLGRLFPLGVIVGCPTSPRRRPVCHCGQQVQRLTLSREDRDRYFVRNPRPDA